jgi:hypothetical protein
MLSWEGRCTAKSETLERLNTSALGHKRSFGQRPLCANSGRSPIELMLDSRLWEIGDVVKLIEEMETFAQIVREG